MRKLRRRKVRAGFYDIVDPLMDEAVAVVYRDDGYRSWFAETCDTSPEWLVGFEGCGGETVRDTVARLQRVYDTRRRRRDR